MIREGVRAVKINLAPRLLSSTMRRRYDCLILPRKSASSMTMILEIVALVPSLRSDDSIPAVEK